MNRAGKIAMKLDDGDGIVGVQIATPEQDVFLTTALGQAIRFPISSLRVFVGRTSTGVRGVALGDGDRVISMSILRHFESSPDERTAYLKMRRAVAGESEAAADDGVVEGEETNGNGAGNLDLDRYAVMSAAEEHILTVSQNGYGKRTSSFEYRVTSRGGKGIQTMVVNDRNGPLVASFPVEETDQIMLVTDRGQLIRVPVDGVRLTGRATQGVIVFSTGADEAVVSVERITEDAEADDEIASDDEGPESPETGES